MIKFLAMDVDGTLTDGKIYMGENGELFKAFDIKDGCGIKDLLPRKDIIPVIITARKSRILENRCRELNITHLYQGERNKIKVLKELVREYSSDDCTYTLSNVAYIGDDVLDLQCMIPVREAGGLAACPADAAEEVLAVSDYVCSREGGRGAVREFIEYLLKRE